MWITSEVYRVHYKLCNPNDIYEQSGLPNYINAVIFVPLKYSRSQNVRSSSMDTSALEFCSLVGHGTSVGNKDLCSQ